MKLSPISFMANRSFASTHHASSSSVHCISNCPRLICLVFLVGIVHVSQNATASCPIDFSGLQNFTSFCNYKSSVDAGTGGNNADGVPSAQILICCEDMYGAAVFAMSLHANATGEMFPSEVQAAECIEAYEEALAASSQLELFQKYCPLAPKRITAGESACKFSTVNDLERFLMGEFGPETGLLSLVAGSCNELGEIGQRGCQGCQSQLLNVSQRLANVTHDQAATCATAVAIAVISRNPSISSFQNFYQCALAFLNSNPIADLLNISSPTKSSSSAIAAAAATEPGSFPHSHDHHRKTLFIIVGISATLVVIVLVGLIVLKAERSFSHGFSGTLLSSSATSDATSVILPTEGFYIFHLKELRKATKNFSEALRVGQGSAGTVYLGRLPSGKLVAVKRITKEQKVETFNKEVALLARIRHPNLTALLGYCQAHVVHLLVYEFMGNGDLGRRLLDPNIEALTWNQRMKIGIDCAKGLAYLHNCPEGPIIHRDIKPTNILLSESLEAKLSDFGLSKVMECEASHVSTEIKGTTGYLDPEYLILGQLTESSDVYSFGVVLLQLLSGRKAIENGTTSAAPSRSIVQMAFLVMKGDAEFASFMDPRLRGEYPVGAARRVAAVAYRCVQARSYDRPSIDDVLEDLELAMRLSEGMDGGGEGCLRGPRPRSPPRGDTNGIIIMGRKWGADDDY